MTTYQEFQDAVISNRVDVARFCHCAKIEPDDIEKARISGKIPNFIALSLMAYIDNIKEHQPFDTKHEATKNRK